MMGCTSDAFWHPRPTEPVGALHRGAGARRRVQRGVCCGQAPGGGFQRPGVAADGEGVSFAGAQIRPQDAKDGPKDGPQYAPRQPQEAPPREPQEAKISPFPSDNVHFQHVRLFGFSDAPRRLKTPSRLSQDGQRGLQKGAALDGGNRRKHILLEISPDCIGSSLDPPGRFHRALHALRRGAQHQFKKSTWISESLGLYCFSCKFPGTPVVKSRWIYTYKIRHVTNCPTSSVFNSMGGGRHRRLRRADRGGEGGRACGARGEVLAQEGPRGQGRTQTQGDEEAFHGVQAPGRRGRQEGRPGAPVLSLLLLPPSSWFIFNFRCSFWWKFSSGRFL